MMFINKSVRKFDFCNICNSKEVIKTCNSEIYGRVYGNGKCFLCLNCGAYVGTHNDGRSLGILSTHSMREKRKRCHSMFDPVWRRGYEKRGRLYGILAKRLGIDKRSCHFGWFDDTMLDKALKVMSKDYWYM